MSGVCRSTSSLPTCCDVALQYSTFAVNEGHPTKLADADADIIQCRHRLCLLAWSATCFMAGWLAGHNHDLLNSHTKLHVIHSLQLAQVCQLVEQPVVCTTRQHGPGV